MRISACFGFAAEAKELREKLADRENVDAASKSAPKRRGKKRATAAEKRMAALNTELADAKALHLQIVEVATRSTADANKARADSQNSQARPVEVE